jgi:hypothetical protein
MRKAPGGAVCSMRAATLTAMPRMLPSASTPPPSRTPPVCSPTRTLKPACPCAASTSAPSVRPSASSASPACTARWASSSCEPSAPNTASRLSPAYCSTLPPWPSTSRVQRASAPSTTACTSSGSSRWLSVVEPTMSRKPAVFSGRGGIPHRRYLHFGAGARERSRPASAGQEVSRPGAKPGPTVTVRMKEIATAAARAGVSPWRGRCFRAP